MLGPVQVSTSLLRQLADHIRAVFWIVDAERRVLYVSPNYEQVFGMSCASVMEDVWSFLRVVHPDDRERLKSIEQTSTFTTEIRIMRSDNTVRWLEIRGFPVEDRSNGAAHTVGITEDITERKDAEALRNQFIERIIAAQEEERGRLARELHDAMAQSLTSLLLRLRALEDLVSTQTARDMLHDLRHLTSQTIEEAQQLARRLRPSVLDDLGFVPAVERLVQECGRNYDLDIELHVRGCGVSTRMTSAVETSLYRILQEALTNVARHAKARHVDVLVERDDGHVRLSVEDDGCGFTTPQRDKGLGILGIRERAKLLRGSMQINSVPGQGTSLSINLPVEA